MLFFYCGFPNRALIQDALEARAFSSGIEQLHFLQQSSYSLPIQMSMKQPFKSVSAHMFDQSAASRGSSCTALLAVKCASPGWLCRHYRGQACFLVQPVETIGIRNNNGGNHQTLQGRSIQSDNTIIYIFFLFNNIVHFRISL